METFHIHQDQEKENTVHALPEKLRSFQNAKSKRHTFAVLNNVPFGARVQPGKTELRNFKPGKIQQKEINDENFAYAEKNQTHTNTTLALLPVEQFKTFSVYEDDSDTVVKHSEDESNANDSNRAIRIPFKEVLSSEGLTPMSIGDAPSPMSIDKSSQLDDDMKPVVQLIVPRNDRERFFEIEEYQMNILEYFRELENKYRPKPLYMLKQPDINYSMRSILIDWLVEVAEEYRLQNETLCLAVTYVDRFLSFMSVVRVKLQLVGTAAMFVAAKYEEIYPPDVGEFVYITDDTYTKTQVLRMEQVLLKTLSFNLCVPTTTAFINTFAVLFQMPDQLKHLTTYISELSLLEADPYLKYLPSQISSAALALARYILELPIWSSKLEEITTYSLGSMKDIILNLCKTHNLSSSMAQQAIQEKYKASKFMHVATIQPVQLTEEQFDYILQEYQSNTVTKKSMRKMTSSLIFV